MHNEARKKRVNTYTRKGKKYDYEYDWDKEFELEIQDIKNAAEEKILEEGNILFQDKKFVEFCENVITTENGLQEYLDCNSELYKINFRLLLLKAGSFEFVDEKILQNETPEQKERFYNEIFNQINLVQSAIISENECNGHDFFKKNEPTYLEKTYLNFLENFAPQMICIATAARPIKEDFLGLMYNLEDLTLNKFAVPNLFDKILDLRDYYDFDVIIEILEIYDKIVPENAKEVNKKYWEEVDKLCSRGVTMAGINRGILNLANVSCSETAGKLIDIIPSRIKSWNTEESLMSEDIDFIVSVIDRFGSMELPPDFLIDTPIITKAMQLVDLKILSEKENKKIIDKLDKAFHKSELETPDMSEYDKQISEKTPFDLNTAINFVKDCKIFTIKEGIMPAKYNEYLIASILEGTSAVNQILDKKDRRFILENYARRRSKEMLGTPEYVTFTKNISPRETVMGLHSMGIMRIVPDVYDDPAVDTVLSLITINHELRHEWQEQNRDKYKFNRLIYMMRKDDILESVDRGFYNRNYERMYIEIDAEYFALRQTRNFLQTLNMTDFKDSPQYEPIMKVINRRIEEQEKNFKLAGERRLQNGEYKSMDDIFAELLKENPQYLEKYPFLKIEYNEDGSKKEDVDFTPKLLDFDE